MMKIKGNKDDDVIELKGDSIESFLRVEEIVEIIILGEKGGVRRILIER